jgi:hypothetical protein
MRKKSHILTFSRPQGGVISQPILIKFGVNANFVDIITPAKFGMDRISNFGLTSGQMWPCAILSCSRPYHFA